ncbi:hypothetical protein OROGR_001651 [Orobanche gracilis]
MGQIQSSTTLKDLERWRLEYQISTNVFLYVPKGNEHADKPSKGMVAVNELIIEAGLRFPLHYAVSHLLTAWNVAPLQLSPNAWLQIVSTYTLFGTYRLHRLLPPGWFWVAGAWKTVLSDNPEVELDIPTGFREKAPKVSFRVFKDPPTEMKKASAFASRVIRREAADHRVTLPLPEMKTASPTPATRTVPPPPPPPEKTTAPPPPIQSIVPSSQVLEPTKTRCETRRSDRSEHPEEGLWKTKNRGRKSLVTPLLPARRKVRKLSKLKAELEVARYDKNQIVGKIVAMEKEFVDAKKVASDEIASLRAANAKLTAEAALVLKKGAAVLANQVARVKVVGAKALEADHARKAVELGKEEAEQKMAEAEQRVAAAEGKALEATKETGVVIEALEWAKQELEELKAKTGSYELDPFSDIDCMSEYAYYLAYSDAIITAAKGGVEVGPLVDAFKVYVAEHPLELVFMRPILDLSTEHGIDLSWYPHQGNLVQSSQPEVPEQTPTAEPAPQSEF